MKNILRRAMMDSETFVVEMVYEAADGTRTRRVVSPIRFVGPDRFLGLCLCREEPRQFHLRRCESLRLIPAAEVMMPMPLETLAQETQLVESVPAYASGSVDAFSSQLAAVEVSPVC